MSVDHDDRQAYAAPEESALAGCPPGARPRVISVTINGDEAVVVYDTEPSKPVTSHCALGTGGWSEVEADW